MRRVLATCGMAAVALLGTVPPAEAASHSHSVRVADLSLIVSGTTRQVQSGDVVTYDVRVRNDGPGVAEDTSVSARLSAGLAIVEVGGADCDEIGSLVSCGPLRLDAGRMKTIHILGIVKPTAVGTVRVSARADSPTPDPALGDNTASLMTPVGPSTDLAVRLAAPRTAPPGARLALTATVANHGPRTAGKVTLHLGVRRSTFAGAEGTSCRVSGRQTHGQFIRCALGPLAAGARRILRVSVRMDPRARTRKATGDFAATASSGMGDSRPANNVAMAHVRFVAPPVVAAAPAPQMADPARELPQTGASPAPLAAAALTLLAVGALLLLNGGGGRLRRGRRPGRPAGSRCGSHRRW